MRRIFLLSAIIVFLFCTLSSKTSFCQNREEATEHFNRGLKYMGMKRIQEAIFEFKKAVERDSKDTGSYLNLASCYFGLGQKQEAIAMLEKAENLGPGGSLFDSLREGEEEKKRFFLLGIGVLYNDMGEFERAIRMFKKAIDLNPSVFISYFRLGECYFKVKMYTEAVKTFKKAIELEPNSGDAHFMLGISQSNTGQFQEAKENLKKAMEIYQRDNENDKVKTARECLRKLSSY